MLEAAGENPPFARRREEFARCKKEGDGFAVQMRSLEKEAAAKR